MRGYISLKFVRAHYERWNGQTLYTTWAYELVGESWDSIDNQLEQLTIQFNNGQPQGWRTILSDEERSVKYLKLSRTNILRILKTLSWYNIDSIVSYWDDLDPTILDFHTKGMFVDDSPREDWTHGH